MVVVAAAVMMAVVVVVVVVNDRDGVTSVPVLVLPPAAASTPVTYRAEDRPQHEKAEHGVVVRRAAPPPVERVVGHDRAHHAAAHLDEGEQHAEAGGRAPAASRGEAPLHDLGDVVVHEEGAEERGEQRDRGGLVARVEPGQGEPEELRRLPEVRQRFRWRGWSAWGVARRHADAEQA